MERLKAHGDDKSTQIALDNPEVNALRLRYTLYMSRASETMKLAQADVCAITGCKTIKNLILFKEDDVELHLCKTHSKEAKKEILECYPTYA